MTPQDMTLHLAMYTWHPVTINYTEIESSLFSNERAVRASEVMSAINAWYYEQIDGPSE
jgi:hypothetical protein